VCQDIGYFSFGVQGSLNKIEKVNLIQLGQALIQEE
jgi:hypothetical protein